MKAQYDAISSLLEPGDAGTGWNWNGLFAYMKKVRLPMYCYKLSFFSFNQAEGYSAPNSQQQAKGAGSVASYHRTSGPVQVTFPDAMYGGPQQSSFATAIQNLTGITHCDDLNGGNANCVAYVPNASR